MCGHGTIGAVTTLIETGWLAAEEPEMAIVVDSPSGMVHTRARVHVESVALQMESAFAFALHQPLEVDGLGRITVDVSFAGGFVEV